MNGTYETKIPKADSVWEALLNGWVCNQQTVKAAGRQGIQLRRGAWFDLPPRLLSRLQDECRTLNPSKNKIEGKHGNKKDKELLLPIFKNKPKIIGVST